MGQPSNLTLWKRPLSPCHPDRSAAQWRDLRFSGPFLEMFFDTNYSRTRQAAKNPSPG
jgi:hypothetical protein